MDKDGDNRDNSSIVSCFVFQTQNFTITLKQPQDGKWEKGKMRYKEKIQHSILVVNFPHIHTSFSSFFSPLSVHSHDIYI